MDVSKMPLFTITRERAVGLKNKVGGDTYRDEGSSCPDPKRIDLADEVVIKRTTTNNITKKKTTEIVRETVREFLNSGGDIDARFKELTGLQKKYAPKLPIASDVTNYVKGMIIKRYLEQFSLEKVNEFVDAWFKYLEKKPHQPHL